MLNRDNIHNSAMLQPVYTKCPAYERVKRHNYALMADKQREQCLDCGKIKLTKKGY